MTLPRFKIKGHAYYVTTVVQDRLSVFIRPTYVILLIDSLNFYRYKLNFKLLGYVIMPDHLHILVWPYGKASISEIMRDYKKFTAVRLIRQVEVEQNKSWLKIFQASGEKTGRSQHKVWQDSFWDENVFTPRFLRQKLNYIHRNPVRAGLVQNPKDYPYSSYRNYVYDDNSLIEIDKEWF